MRTFLREDEKDMQWENFLEADEKRREGETVTDGVKEDKGMELANLLAGLELDTGVSNNADPSKDEDAMDLD